MKVCLTNLLPGLVYLSSRHEADPGDPVSQLEASYGGQASPLARHLAGEGEEPAHESCPGGVGGGQVAQPGLHLLLGGALQQDQRPEGVQLVEGLGREEGRRGEKEKDSPRECSPLWRCRWPRRT